MKPFAIPLIICLSFASAIGVANADVSDNQAVTPLTRHQVKMETAEFLKTHRYDYFQDIWTLNSGVEPPAGVRSRADVKSERDDFLRKNTWNNVNAQWTPMKTPRDLNSLTRDQVRAENAQFQQTHTYDELDGSWKNNATGKRIN